MNPEFVYMLNLLSAVTIPITTIAIIALSIWYKQAPEPQTIVIFAFLWVVTIKFNPVWKELWKK